MVFSSAQAGSSSYMSFLKRFESRTSTEASTLPNRPASKPTPNSTTARVNTTNSTQSRPLSTITRPAPATSRPITTAAKPTSAASSVSKSQPTTVTTTTQSTHGIKINGSSASKPEVTSSGVKRKAEEEISRPRGLAGTFSKTSTPSIGQLSPVGAASKSAAESSKAPKKGSYAELLARAKTLTETQRAPVGAIVNRPTAPAEKKQKEWQKKFQEERAAKTGGERNSKSPGFISGGEKAAPKAAADVKDKAATTKKVGGDTAGSLKRGISAVDRKPAIASSASSLSSASAKGKAGPADAKSRAAVRERDRSSQRRPSRDENPTKSRHDRPASRAPPRYVYREDSYDSDESDMEAAGIEILEEEEISAKRARLEDLEQERLEKQHIADKARRKAMTMGKKG